MALFVPIIIGLPIGYFTWAKVFDTVDTATFQTFKAFNNNSKDSIKPPNSTLAATLGTAVSVGILSKLLFTPHTRHRLFFAKAPANSNIRVETLKMGMELLFRSGALFYGGATGGAVAGRLLQKK